jgi:cytochrome P450
MVIKETLRMYPPAWIFARRSLEEVTVGGHTIEKDGTVIISPYLTQHRPDYFPDPETFNPERFAPGYEKSLPRFAYFPFGGGNNFCVGHGFAMMEMKVIVALLLQRYRFVMDPAQTITAKASTTLRPREGVPVRVTAREHAAEVV